MNIQTDIPQIAVLREAVEAQEGRMMRTHPDFVKLRQAIYGNSREFISESTLERVWEYSTRGYETVSLRTLDVLARFVGCKDWDYFCRVVLDKDDSEFIEKPETVDADNLPEGTRIRLCWMPDQTVIIRHLGNDHFVVENCKSSKLSEGDKFICKRFHKGQPAFMDFPHGLFIAGKEHGVTFLEIQDPV